MRGRRRPARGNTTAFRLCRHLGLGDVDPRPESRRGRSEEAQNGEIQPDHLRRPGIPPGAPDVMAHTLNREEAFVVEARFQLQDSGVPSLGVPDSPYEMKVYVSEVTSGRSRLLITYSATLMPDVLEYAAQANAPGLSTGVYHLFTLVTLGEPRGVSGHHDGPVIRVI